MARSSFQPKFHSDLLLRVFDLGGRSLDVALAEALLALDFPEADANRIQELNTRANEGELTPDEEAELEALINVGDLLAYWQSKARQRLARPA